MILFKLVKNFSVIIFQPSEAFGIVKNHGLPAKRLDNHDLQAVLHLPFDPVIEIKH
jgi:hypothetical protein